MGRRQRRGLCRQPAGEKPENGRRRPHGVVNFVQIGQAGRGQQRLSGVAIELLWVLSQRSAQDPKAVFILWN